MDQFVQFQQVLDRHHIPYHARDRRPMQSPRVTITHGDLFILECFDRTGAYAHLALADAHEEVAIRARTHNVHQHPLPTACLLLVTTGIVRYHGTVDAPGGCTARWWTTARTTAGARPFPQSSRTSGGPPASTRISVQQRR